MILIMNMNTEKKVVCAAWLPNSGVPSADQGNLTGLAAVIHLEHLAMWQATTRPSAVVGCMGRPPHRADFG